MVKQTSITISIYNAFKLQDIRDKYLGTNYRKSQAILDVLAKYRVRDYKKIKAIHTRKPTTTEPVIFRSQEQHDKYKDLAGEMNLSNFIDNVIEFYEG